MKRFARLSAKLTAGVGVGVLIGLAGLVTTAPAHADVAPQPIVSTSDACQNVLIIGARGSGESSAAGNGLGLEAWGAAQAYASQMNGYRVGYYAVPYEAAPIESLLTLATAPLFFASIDHGVQLTLSSFLYQRAQTCKDEHYVLMGFSQGAMVMHRVLTQLADAASLGNHQDLLSRIDGVLAIADGDKYPNEGGTNYGSAPVGNGGVWWFLTDLGVPLPTSYPPAQAIPDLPAYPVWPASRFHNVCFAEDLVCDPKAPAWSFPIAEQAAAIAFHGNYYQPKGGGSSIVNQAAADIATESHQLNPLTITKTLPTVSAQVGYHSQLTLPPLPKAVQWIRATVDGWPTYMSPPGLRVSPAPLAAGQPLVLTWSPPNPESLSYAVHVGLADGTQEVLTGALTATDVPIARVGAETSATLLNGAVIIHGATVDVHSLPGAQVSPVTPDSSTTLSFKWTPPAIMSPAASYPYGATIMFTDGTQEDFQGALVVFPAPLPSFSLSNLQSQYVPSSGGAPAYSSVSFDLTKTRSTLTPPGQFYYTPPTENSPLSDCWPSPFFRCSGAPGPGESNLLLSGYTTLENSASSSISFAGSNRFSGTPDSGCTTTGGLRCGIMSVGETWTYRGKVTWDSPPGQQTRHIQIYATDGSAAPAWLELSIPLTPPGGPGTPTPPPGPGTGPTPPAVSTVEFTSPAALPALKVGNHITFTVTTTRPSLFTIAGGALPAGLTLSPDGVISGTPTAADTYAFIVRADDGKTFNTQSFTGAVTGTAVVASSTPTNDVPKSTATAGTPFVVTGSGFPSGETVQVYLHSTPVLLGTLIADAEGNIRGTFTIPANTEAGVHHIVFVEPNGKQYLSGDVTVSVASSAGLASTGFDGLPFAGLAALLLLAGARVVMIARRKAMAK